MLYMKLDNGKVNFTSIQKRSSPKKKKKKKKHAIKEMTQQTKFSIIVKKYMYMKNTRENSKVNNSINSIR